MDSYYKKITLNQLNGTDIMANDFKETRGGQTDSSGRTGRAGKTGKPDRKRKTDKDDRRTGTGRKSTDRVDDNVNTA
jgi:hypothetical protein